MKISCNWLCLCLFFSINFIKAYRNLHELDLSRHYLNIFTSTSLYDEASKEINIYGQSHYKINFIKLDEELDFEIVHYPLDH